MSRLHASIWIACTPEEVFGVLEEPNRRLFPPHGPHVFRLSPSCGIGTRYRLEFRRMGLSLHVDCSVTEYVPGCRLAFKSAAGWTMNSVASLKPEAGGTRLDLQATYTLPPVLRWLVPGGLIRLSVWQTLCRAKLVSEEARPLRVIST
ncbi:MAG: SRPBCC family protein [Mycobacterium leprae]